MQWVSSRIWTRVAVFISYDDNNYTTGMIYKSVFPSVWYICQYFHFLNELKLICLFTSIAFVAIQLNSFNYCNLTLIILFNINYLFAHSEVVTSINTYYSFKHYLIIWMQTNGSVICNTNNSILTHYLIFWMQTNGSVICNTNNSILTHYLIIWMQTNGSVICNTNNSILTHYLIIWMQTNGSVICNTNNSILTHS